MLERNNNTSTRGREKKRDRDEKYPRKGKRRRAPY